MQANGCAPRAHMRRAMAAAVLQTRRLAAAAGPSGAAGAAFGSLGPLRCVAGCAGGWRAAAPQTAAAAAAAAAHALRAAPRPLPPSRLPLRARRPGGRATQWFACRCLGTSGQGPAAAAAGEPADADAAAAAGAEAAALPEGLRPSWQAFLRRLHTRGYFEGASSW
jgi:hypothetical protein